VSTCRHEFISPHLTIQEVIRPTRQATIPGNRKMSLAVRMKAMRLRRRESLQDVADSIGASKTHIWELESGRAKNPSLELLTKLANHFRVPIRSLVGESDQEAKDEDLVRMFRQLSELPERDRAHIDDLLQSYIRRRKEQ